MTISKMAVKCIYKYKIGLLIKQKIKYFFGAVHFRSSVSSILFPPTEVEGYNIGHAYGIRSMCVITKDKCHRHDRFCTIEIYYLVIILELIMHGFL